MVIRVTATKARAQLGALLDQVEGGDEIEIIRDGRAVAWLVRANGPGALKDSLAGVAVTVARDEELFSAGGYYSQSHG